MLTKEELEARRGYIGASDCAAVLGLSRWKSQLEIWGEKTGILPSESSDSIAAEIGNELEDYVARRFMKKTGKKVHRVNKPYVHPKYPFIQCHVDRELYGENAILQCKTCSAWKAKEWEDEEIPQEYFLQEYHELACSRADVAHVAVLIGNHDFKMKEIFRDEKIISDIIEKEAYFWNTFVVPKVMPKTVRRDDSDTLYKLFPMGDEEKVITLGEEANILVDAIDAMSAEFKASEGSIEKMKNELKLMLGDSAVGLTDRFRITWKNQTRKAYTKVCPESVSRVLRTSILKDQK